jgi:hypothetical protein
VNDNPTDDGPGFISGQLTAQRSWVHARIVPILERLQALGTENRELRDAVATLSKRVAELERQA